MQAGYSKKPLTAKLSIKEGFHIALIGAPENYLTHTLGALPANVTISYDLQSTFDLVHIFVQHYGTLAEQFPALKVALKQSGALWVSWPKRSAKVPTDVDENRIRELGLSSGLVDVKVCAVDEVWSGLKFVYRLKDRVS